MTCKDIQTQHTNWAVPDPIAAAIAASQYVQYQHIVGRAGRRGNTGPPTANDGRLSTIVDLDTSTWVILLTCLDAILRYHRQCRPGSDVV